MLLAVASEGTSDRPRDLKNEDIIMRSVCVRHGQFVATTVGVVMVVVLGVVYSVCTNLGRRELGKIR